MNGRAFQLGMRTGGERRRMNADTALGHQLFVWVVIPVLIFPRPHRRLLDRNDADHLHREGPPGNRPHPRFL